MRTVYSVAAYGVRAAGGRMSMKKKHVLISGAGIAGPALAYWLDRFGFEVTVVERARDIREGGQAVDFRGATQRRVLEHMGLWSAIAERQTKLGDIVALDPRGSFAWSLPSTFMSGDVEILRGDLSRLLYERTRERARYLFGDSITAIENGEHEVFVTFESGARERFDWVIGADGMRSKVRSLVMADQPNVLAHT
jgi:2-polyprenyl-6-methoxyphenol hydroxylase-like FAD-dependent oxidoreductase